MLSDLVCDCDVYLVTGYDKEKAAFVICDAYFEAEKVLYYTASSAILILCKEMVV